MTLKYQLANIRTAVEAHFADVDRLGIRQGKNLTTSTIIYIDNIKTLSIASTKSKIAVCKIYDPRIKAILNSYQVGYMFINSKYSHMFGYDKDMLLNTIMALIHYAIPNCTDDRVKTERKHMTPTWRSVHISATIAMLLGVIIPCVLYWVQGLFGDSTYSLYASPKIFLLLLIVIVIPVILISRILYRKCDISNVIKIILLASYYGVSILLSFIIAINIMGLDL